MLFVDTHCHLNLFQPTNVLDQIIENAISHGITRIMVPGIDLDSSIEAIRIAEKYEIVYAAVGYHPNDANKWTEESYTTLQKLAQHPKVKAIGEIGLDFYRDHAPASVQIKVFQEQLRLSEVTNKPVIVHSRNSLMEVINILLDWSTSNISRNPNKIFGVMHAFEGDLEQARKIVEHNFFVGIGGPVTYKNAHEKHSIATNLKIDKILLETDSPFLSPHPVRGKTNEPANIKFIAEKIATLTEKPLKWVSQETTKNANRIFAWEQ